MKRNETVIDFSNIFSGPRQVALTSAGKIPPLEFKENLRCFNEQLLTLEESKV
jgi:hypothetical protein